MMQTGDVRQEIREKIMTYEYDRAGSDIWKLLDSYDECLRETGSADELAEAAFLRGEAAFRRGRYHDTMSSLTKCLAIAKTPEYMHLETEAYNLLGMLFSFVGYETVALDSYLSAIESARKNRNLAGQISAILNSGLLYQSLLEYRKAMGYYQYGNEIAGSSLNSPDMFLVLLCMIQEAQLFCRMGRYEDAKRTQGEIEAYHQAAVRGEKLLPKCILDVWLEEYYGTEDGLTERIAIVRQYLDEDKDYLEQIDFYVDFCAFLLQHDRQREVRYFLDVLSGKLAATEFLQLQIQMEEIEVEYQKKYGSEEQFQLACRHYITVNQNYEYTLKKFKQQNLLHIESLQKLEKQKSEFEYRSRFDLATGLLNKENFKYEVKTYLEERNRDIMDALVIMDVDEFKQVNDRFGHLTGDEVIVKLAAHIKNWFANGEICGRFGGDEFIVFIPHVRNTEELEIRLEGFHKAFSEMQFGKDGEVKSTLSIGVSYNNGINASYTEMFACADEALLKVKEYGRNRVAFYEIKRGLLKYV